MRFILLLIISFFLIFPSYACASGAYDEKIKLNRSNIEIGSKKETIKVTRNEMVNLRKIKTITKEYDSIELYLMSTAGKKVKKEGRITYRSGSVDIYEKNANSVVYIGNTQGNSMGTGFVIGKNWNKVTNIASEKYLILTNWHVIDGAKKVQIWLKPDELEKMDERVLVYEPSFTGGIVKSNSRKDLALIEVDGFPKNIGSVKFGKIEDVPIGSTVYSIGHPEGQTWTFNSGMVTQIRPNYQWRYNNSTHRANIIQHEVPTNPGNSGGPLFNEKGLMVGVNSFLKGNAQLINFSVAIDEVEKFLKEKVNKNKGKSKYIKKKKKPTYITRKSKDKKTSSQGEEIKKTYPNAIPGDVNDNGIEDVWYIDDDKNGKIDTAFVDHDEDGIIEAIMIDDNENKYFEIITLDNDLNGYPDLLYIDRDEDGEDDVVAYDYDEDGEWDKYERLG
jgi:S1-C subfamily serine protease|tara:strand:+ start:515 stop:1852 length:1338 start_codon:yes stop_codon:yes gene_type:complete